MLDALQTTGERALPLDGLGRDELGEASGEAPEIRLVPQRTIESRGRHFERVRVVELLLAELVFHVQQGAQVLADALAILDADAVLGGFYGARRGPIDD